ncbi:hypothetical protein FQZ97_932900 [compost metagenome]
MGHLVAHDHGGLVVGELQLLQDAGVESDLAARHAERVHLIAADQVDLPLPVGGAFVPLRGVRNDAARDVAQPLNLWVAGRQQELLGVGFAHRLRILLVRSALEFFGRHQVAQGRCLAHIHLCGGWQHSAHSGCSAREQEAAAGRPDVIGPRQGGWVRLEVADETHA